MRYFLIAAVLLAAACGKSAPSPPSVGDSPPVTIRGTEKLAWDQAAADPVELSGIGYDLYIDGAPIRLNGVACSGAQTAAGFECKAPIPGLAPGTHVLELSSYYLTNPENKSARAGPLTVTLNPLISGDAGSSRAASRSVDHDVRDPADAAWPAGTVQVARGLDQPADLAFTPDNRLLIAERSGHVRVVRDMTLLDEPALSLPAEPGGRGGIVALAIDPDFARTRFVYAIYTERARSGELVFTLARYREAGDTLGDRIVVLDDVRASSDAHAVLRFGPDGKLYAAFDDGGDQRLVEDLASYNGKVLRLNPDGSTPDDAPRKSPIWLEGVASPRGLGWHAATGHLWTATESYVDAVRWTSTPNALAIFRDDLLVGSDAGLVRAKLDVRSPGRIAAAEDLFHGLAVRALAIRPDGAVFFATPDAVGILNQQ